jgi:hypothetical protein
LSVDLAAQHHRFGEQGVSVGDGDKSSLVSDAVEDALVLFDNIDITIRCA